MKQQLKRRKILGISFLTIIIASFISCGNMDQDKKLFISNYLPFLTPLSVSDINVKKIDSDPNYLRPYNIYVRFKVDSVSKQKLIKLFSDQKSAIDTFYLKRIYSPKQYLLYFSMESINAFRNGNLKNRDEWWNENKLEDCTNILVSPYLDDHGVKGFAYTVREANGRVAFCSVSNYCYLLIECWG